MEGNFSVQQKFQLTLLTNNNTDSSRPLRPYKTEIYYEIPYMTETLRRAIVTRSRLRNRFYKTNSVEDKANFKKQKLLQQIV